VSASDNLNGNILILDEFLGAGGLFEADSKGGRLRVVFSGTGRYEGEVLAKGEGAYFEVALNQAVNVLRRSLKEGPWPWWTPIYPRMLSRIEELYDQ
jgi:hypothetical protein